MFGHYDWPRFPLSLVGQLTGNMVPFQLILRMEHCHQRRRHIANGQQTSEHKAEQLAPNLIIVLAVASTNLLSIVQCEQPILATATAELGSGHVERVERSNPLLIVPSGESLGQQRFHVLGPVNVIGDVGGGGR